MIEREKYEKLESNKILEETPALKALHNIEFEQLQKIIKKKGDDNVKKFYEDAKSNSERKKEK